MIKGESIQENLGYTFQNERLLELALTHSSYANEMNSDEYNERLEFLGDAVLELAISDLLYRYNEKLSEGSLTKLRASLVCEHSLAAVAREVHVGKYIKLGKGEHSTGGFDRDSILSDAMEALFGAIYLDGGFEATQNVIQELFSDRIGNVNPTDPKTDLQEIMQRNGGVSAVYTIIDESGPPHQREFTASASKNGRVIGTGKGKSKKEAEQNAAYQALKTINSSRGFSNS